MQINFWDGYFFQDGVRQKKQSCKCTPATPKWAPFDIFSSKKVIHILKRIILFHRMKNNDKAKVILKNNTSKKQFAFFFQIEHREAKSSFYISSLTVCRTISKSLFLKVAENDWFNYYYIEFYPSKYTFLAVWIRTWWSQHQRINNCKTRLYLSADESVEV